MRIKTKISSPIDPISSVAQTPRSKDAVVAVVALSVPDDVGYDVVAMIEPALDVHIPAPPVEPPLAQVDVASAVIRTVTFIIVIMT